MLTKTAIGNINNFENLTPNHQRVFKHRLIKKCEACIKNLELALLNSVRLGLKVDKIIDLQQLTSLIETYEEINMLQNL